MSSRHKSLFEIVDALISVSILMMSSSCFDFSKEVESEERIDCSDFGGWGGGGVGCVCYGGREIPGC